MRLNLSSVVLEENLELFLILLVLEQKIPFSLKSRNEEGNYSILRKLKA